MSICMPLGDKNPRPDLRVTTRLRPNAARPGETTASPDDRIGDLEARMERLESGHLTALNLVRRALATLKDSQTEQNLTQSHAISRLAAQLGECESALARLDSTQRRDDETMRERLFDMGEALDGVRVMAAAAVRPGALRKMERTLEKQIEACAQTLRNDLGEQITEAVEAAEGRSADALDALEDEMWDEMTELARRFDCLADTVAEFRMGVAAPADHDEVPDAVYDAIDPEPGAPTPDDDVQTIDRHTDEDDTDGADELGPAEPVAIPAGVIPFPAQVHARREMESDQFVAPDGNVGTVLSAAARRVDEAAEEIADDDHDLPERAPGPLGRLMTSAGSAVMAVCIMGGLSLLAGPALGPNLQGAPPAFAHDNADWTPVRHKAQPIDVKLRLTPILQQSGAPHPVRKVPASTSDR